MAGELLYRGNILNLFTLLSAKCEILRDFPYESLDSSVYLNHTLGFLHTFPSSEPEAIRESSKGLLALTSAPVPMACVS